VSDTAVPSPSGDELDEVFQYAPSPAALKRSMKRNGLFPVSGPPPKEELALSVASFNVLGASHTAGANRRRFFGPGPARVPGQIAMLEARKVTLAGFQEFQTPQVHTFLGQTRGRWEVYPGTTMGPLLADNSIGWRTDTWKAVERRIIQIPYFGGHPRGMPYVLLEELHTGHRVWLLNVHNPANIGGDFARFRNQAVQMEARLVRQLGADGTPVLFTGDMNDRREFACPLTAASGMHSADGARTVGRSCTVPPRMSVDWIMGTSQVAFTDYRQDWNARHRRLTDHPLITATATLPPADNATKCKVGASTKGYLWFCPRKR